MPADPPEPSAPSSPTGDHAALAWAVLGAVPLLLFSQDRSLRYTWVQNPTLGLDRETILGRTDEELLGPEAAAPLVRIKRRVLETGQGERQEIRVARGPQDGLYNLMVEPVRDPTGEVTGLIGVAADITSRRQAEEELRQWADAFTHCAHGIALGLPTSNAFLACNPAFARMHGRTVEEIVGAPILSLYAPEEHGYVRDRIAEADRLGQVRYETRMRRGDGTTFPVQVDLVSVRDAAGGLRYRVATVQDIEERRTVEAALAHRTRALETVRSVGMELTRDLRLPRLLDRIIREALGLIGGAWGVLWLWDPAAEHLVPGAFVGHDPGWFSAVRLRLGEGVSGTAAQRRAGLIVPDVEASGLRAAALRDPRAPEAVMAEPLLYQDRLIGTIALDRWKSDPPFTAQDAELLQLFGAYAAIAIENARLYAAAQEELAARMAANTALRESRAQLFALTESTPDAIFIKDSLGRYLMVNAALCALLGLARDEILGKDDRALFPPEAAARLMEHDRAVLADGALHTCEEALPTRRGMRTYLVVKGLLPDFGAGSASLFGVSRDITDQKQAQAHAQRAQRLESLGALASGIAHDMNNVLTPILMGVEEMKAQVTDEDGRSVLEMMETSARRGAQTLQQILGFVRGAEVSRVPTRPMHVVDEVLAFVRQAFPKSIQVYSDCCPSPWLFTGNASQLHQVLMNLCLNARDAMPEGGVLSIDVENVTFTDEEARRHPDARPGSYVAVRIADSGTGIPLENLDQIFDPFFTTKPQGRGTGLGLATTLGIVQAHGGFILVDSTPGTGTTFTVFFPALAESAPSEPATDVPQGHEGRGEWVLVVDDEAPICRVTASTLGRHGYRPLTAPSAQEALRLWREHRGRIAVVLTDLMMPFQDGFALMRELTAQDPDVRILAASGLATSEHVTRARDLGARAVLAKPYSADELLAALHHALHAP